MRVLIAGTIKRKEVDARIKAAEKKFSNAVLVHDDSIGGYVNKEWCFNSGGLKGRYRIFEDSPEALLGLASFHLVFEDVLPDRTSETEAAAEELFQGAERVLAKAMLEEPIKDQYISRMLSPRFIDAMGLNLRKSAGVMVNNGHMRIEIVQGIKNTEKIYAVGAGKFGEKTIGELGEETSGVIKTILALRKANARAKSKPLVRALDENDLGWWDVTGVGKGSFPGYTTQGSARDYISEASAGFKTLDFPLGNFFRESFLEAFGNVTALKVVKEKEGKNYWIKVGNSSSFGTTEPVSASVTVKRYLGPNREHSAEVKPEVIRLTNVLYALLTQNANARESFLEYIEENANDICLCGRKLCETLDKDIVQTGCLGEQKHLMHKECWENWKEKNKPKQFDWHESVCPFCGEDSSVYNTPWTVMRVAWKNTGP